MNPSGRRCWAFDLLESTRWANRTEIFANIVPRPSPIRRTDSFKKTHDKVRI
jgi:hypothetical protein